MAFANGLRPGVHGQTLVSTGLQDMDQLLGGGLALGAVLLILEDGTSRHHEAVVRYFLAEGVASGHMCLLAGGRHVAGGNEEAAKWLPKEGKPSPKEAKEDEDEDKDNAELRIAWQYRRYIKAKQDESEAAAAEERRAKKAASSSSGFRRPGSATDTVKKGMAIKWCHDYDLTKPMGAEYIAEKGGRLERLDISARDVSSRDIAARIASFVAPPPAPSTPETSATTPSASTTVPAGASPTTPTPAAAAAPVTTASGRQLHPALAARLAQRQQQLLQQQQAAKSGEAAATLTAPVAPVPRPVGGASGQVANVDPKEVRRVALLSLGGPDCQFALSASSPADLERDIFSIVHQLKMTLSGAKACAVVTLPAALVSPSLSLRLQYLCQGVLGLEPVRDTSDIVGLVKDPQSCAGLLRVVKLPVIGSMCCVFPDVDLYLIRHRRRRLAVQPIEVDPDALEAQEQAAQQAAQQAKLPTEAKGASRGIDF